MRFRSGLMALACSAGLVVAAGCGGGSSPTSPSSGSAVVQSSGAVSASGATITISASGAVSPSSVTIAIGQSVTFVNNDSKSHDMSSDPHPSHTNCPSINNVSNISPGQTKLTFGFAGAGSCGFHDHNDPSNASLKGTIVIR